MRRQSAQISLLFCVCLMTMGLLTPWAQPHALARRLIRIKGESHRTADTGDVVQTDANERVALLYDDDSLVRLNEHTILLSPRSPLASALSVQLVQRDAGSTSASPGASPADDLPGRFVLYQGEAWLRLNPARRVRVEMPTAAAVAETLGSLPHGTELNVEVAADGAATVTVGVGAVQLMTPQGRVVVRTGQQSVARLSHAPSPPQTAAAYAAAQWTRDVQPVALLLETSFLTPEPDRRTGALKALGPVAASRSGRRPESLAEPAPRGTAGTERASTLQHRGDVCHDRGDLKAALAAYEAAEQALDPTAPVSQRARLAARRGQTLLELGKGWETAAEAAFRNSLALDATGAEARVGLVMVLLSQRQNDAALAEAQLAVKADEGSPVTHTALALVFLRLRDRPAAFQELAQALRLDPMYPQAYAWRSFLLRTEGRAEDAITDARRAKALAPSSSLARQALADALLAQGRTRQARAEAAQAVKLNPRSLAARASLGRALLREGEIHRAAREAGQALALDPDLDGARFFLGIADLERRQLQATAAELEPLLARDRDPKYLDLAAQALLARIDVDQGRPGDAVDRARIAMARDASFAPAHAALGRIYWRTGQLKAAELQYQEALRLEPETALYELELARAYLDDNNLPDALASGLEALRMAPDSGEAHAVLGLVYDRMSSNEQALLEYRTAVLLSPDSALGHLGLGTASGGADERLREITRALSDLPGGSGSNPSGPPPGIPPSSKPGPPGLGASGPPGRMPPGLGSSRQAERRPPGLDPSARSGRTPPGIGSLTTQPDLGHLQAFIYGNLDPLDGLREVTQSLAMDPSVASRILKAGITTELTPGEGSHTTYAIGLTHRREIQRGSFYDLLFASQSRGSNYRNHGPENRSLAWINLATAPSDRTHVLAQYFYVGGQRALPGSTLEPDPNSRSSVWDNWWDLTARHQLDPATSVWLHAAHRSYNAEDQDPDAQTETLHRSGILTELRRTRLTQLGLEGRLDHRWGRDHTVSYLLFAGRDQFENAERRFDLAVHASEDRAVRNRLENLSQTLQEAYRPASRLSLTLGITHEQLRQKEQAREPDGSVGEDRDTSESHWLPFAQAFYRLTQRDGLRATAYQRRQLLFNPALTPSEAFLGTAFPTLAVGGQARNFELDYEHRFAPSRFAKLFFFRSDVDDFLVTPAVRQTPELIGFVVPAVHSTGVGARYEQQLGQFLWGYLRYTYQETIDQTERSTHGWQLPMSPRSRAALGVSYIDRAGTKLFAEAWWNSRMFIDPIWSDDIRFDPNATRPTFPSRLVVNLGFALERTLRREWVFQIYNLFNTETIYWPDFPAPGRTYQLQYRVRF